VASVVSPVVVLIALAAGSSRAQDGLSGLSGMDAGASASGATVPALAGGPGYRATQSGAESQFLIDVQVWGQVHQPGLYAVRDRTDVIGLLSYAGGPTDDAKLEDVRLIRADGAPGVERIDLQAFVVEGKRASVGALRPGDVLLVPANRSHKLLRFTSVLSFLTLAANVAILATRN
jgi:hypothetical protein